LHQINAVLYYRTARSNCNQSDAKYINAYTCNILKLLMIEEPFKGLSWQWTGFQNRRRW